MYGDLFFGLPNSKEILKVKIEWPDGKIEIKNNAKADNTIEFKYQEAIKYEDKPKGVSPLFIATGDINFEHKENYVNDFSYQIFLPYMYSNAGSRMAKGDVNGDKLDDLYLGGARGQPGNVYLQHANGKFFPSVQPSIIADSLCEDQDAVFFDADNDKDLDLYVVSGEYHLPVNDKRQQDRLYLNDGKGNFNRDINALPPEFLNSKFVKVFDLENDGDLDLFVGGYVLAFKYPLASPSLILKNNGKGNFTLASSMALGLLTDAEIIDINKDGFNDLIIVGEWMGPRVLINNSGNLIEKTDYFKRNLSGWWNRIVASDLDNDGDMDLVVGNLGRNNQMQISEKNPLMLYFNDFDKNGSIDAIMTYYINGKSFPNMSRDEALEQMVSLRKKFTDYKSYSIATIDDILSNEEYRNAFKFQINFSESCVFENKGKSFVLRQLPLQGQFATVHSIAVDDFDKDGKKDILLAGNNSNYRLRIGKMDANHGILIKGDGKFGFKFIPQNISGLKLKGDVKDIQKINSDRWVFFINNDKALTYKLN